VIWSFVVARSLWCCLLVLPCVRVISRLDAASPAGVFIIRESNDPSYWIKPSLILNSVDDVIRRFGIPSKISYRFRLFGMKTASAVFIREACDQTVSCAFHSKKGLYEMRVLNIPPQPQRSLVVAWVFRNYTCTHTLTSHGV